MKKLHRVLVGVDFSDPARAAFEHALALSRANDAELTVVHAVPADQQFRWHGSERAVLMRSLREAAHAAGVRIKESVQHGNPAAVILLHARARQADLIVLGTSARTGLDRLRFGSVAETVAFDATQPVLVVPPASTANGAAPSLANVLVAVDLGEDSREAVERALAISTDKGRVTVLHVIRGTPPESAPRYMYYLMAPEYQRQLSRDAWRRMQEIVPRHVRAERQVHVRVVAGDPATAIARVAGEVDAGVVLMGTGGRSAIGRLVFGSTAARLIRTAQRPVLLMPPALRQAQLPLAA